MIHSPPTRHDQIGLMKGTVQPAGAMRGFRSETIGVDGIRLHCAPIGCASGSRTKPVTSVSESSN
jgi:hypothetical protein